MDERIVGSRSRSHACWSVFLAAAVVADEPDASKQRLRVSELVDRSSKFKMTRLGRDMCTSRTLGLCRIGESLFEGRLCSQGKEITGSETEATQKSGALQY